MDAAGTNASNFIKLSFVRLGIDASLNPHKITDFEPMSGHTEAINVG
jgi:hypothetical protein